VVLLAALLQGFASTRARFLSSAIGAVFAIAVTLLPVAQSALGPFGTPVWFLTSFISYLLVRTMLQPEFNAGASLSGDACRIGSGGSHRYGGELRGSSLVRAWRSACFPFNTQAGKAKDIHEACANFTGAKRPRTMINNEINLTVYRKKLLRYCAHATLTRLVRRVCDLQRALERYRGGEKVGLVRTRSARSV